MKISKAAFYFMLEESKKSREIETGGILIGYKDKEKFICVKKATAPGPKAVRKPDWFERDVKYCQKILDKEYQKYGNESIYVGEWHYHPCVSNIPSNQDLFSLSEIARLSNYLVDNPVMIIFSKDNKVSCTVHPFDQKFYFTEYIIK